MQRKCERKKSDLVALFFNNGAAEMNRTPDLFITNELLYQLSYCGKLSIITKVLSV